LNIVSRTERNRREIGGYLVLTQVIPEI